MKTQQERIAELAHELVAHCLKHEAMFDDMQAGMAARNNWTPEQVQQEIKNTITVHVTEAVANAKLAIAALDEVLAIPDVTAGAKYRERETRSARLSAINADQKADEPL